MRMKSGWIAVAAGIVLVLTVIAAPASAGTTDDAEPMYATCNQLTSVEYEPTGRHVNLPSIGAGTNQIDCELSLGDYNNWGVVALQQSLHHCGAPQVDIDGDYGPITRDVITWIQAANGINADGRYGPQTRGYLRWATFTSTNQFYNCVTIRF